MDSTPIFDELRHLYGKSPDWLTDLPSPEAAPQIDLQESSPGSGRPTIKIIIAGGRGVGKTTFVGSASDTDPVKIEMATDFARIPLHPDLMLYLFGTSEPAQPECDGALGAVVLVDARQIQEAFATINHFEKASVPFLVAVNMFDGEFLHGIDELREALAVGTDIPLMTCDARDPGSTAKVLQQLVSHTLNLGVSDSSFFIELSREAAAG